MTTTITLDKYSATFDRCAERYDAQRVALYETAVALGGIVMGGFYAPEFAIVDREICRRMNRTDERLRTVAKRHGLIA